jgi:hypothetical protein
VVQRGLTVFKHTFSQCTQIASDKENNKLICELGHAFGCSINILQSVNTMCFVYLGTQVAMNTSNVFV